MKLAYVPVVVYVHKSDLRLINIFCAVIVVKKCIMATLGSLLIFCTAYKQDTFVLMTKVTNFAHSAVQTEKWSLIV